MGDSETSLSSLLCEEDESCLKVQAHYKDENFAYCSVSDTDPEQISLLIQRETSFLSNIKDLPMRCERKWLSSARLDAIKWILDVRISSLQVFVLIPLLPFLMQVHLLDEYSFYFSFWCLQTRARFGLQFGTAYLSLIYLDRFLSRKTIEKFCTSVIFEGWNVVGSSIAIPSLLIFGCENRGIRITCIMEVCVDDYDFDGNVIQRMELLVLTTLEWRMRCVTPFAYFNYFIIKFCGALRDKELVTRATELTLLSMEEINAAEHRPSSVAAAAILAAYDYGSTRKIVEIKISEFPSLEKDHTFSCYTLLQRILESKSNTPKTIITPNSRSITNSSSIDVLDDAARIMPKAGINRRLSYTDVDENVEQCSSQKISQP